MDSPVTPWTEQEEQRFLALLDRSFLEGRNSRYPKLNYEQIAAVMNREAIDRNEVLRVYNSRMIQQHYRLIMARKYVTTADLAAGQLSTAQAISKIVDEAMEQSVQADRRVAETTERLAKAVTASDREGEISGSSIELEEAILAAKAAGEYFVAMAEDAERAIMKAKRAIEDAKEGERLKP